ARDATAKRSAEWPIVQFDRIVYRRLVADLRQRRTQIWGVSARNRDAAGAHSFPFARMRQGFSQGGEYNLSKTLRDRQPHDNSYKSVTCSIKGERGRPNPPRKSPSALAARASSLCATFTRAGSDPEFGEDCWTPFQAARRSLASAKAAHQRARSQR